MTSPLSRRTSINEPVDDKSSSAMERRSILIADEGPQTETSN
ncbi:hypothetical protein GBAR_LOCUS14304, partial [Geodia barretti]